MELGSITLWLDEVDTMYHEIIGGPVEIQGLAYNLLRAYVWPLYDLAD